MSGSSLFLLLQKSFFTNKRRPRFLVSQFSGSTFVSEKVVNGKDDIPYILEKERFQTTSQLLYTLHEAQINLYSRCLPWTSPFELRGWGWSHPFSSGPGIFLYKMTWLNLQNGLPGNFSTKCLALDRFFSLQNECWKFVKTGLNLFLFIKMVFQGCFQTCFKTQFVD